jgi:hypothetical protein
MASLPTNHVKMNQHISMHPPVEAHLCASKTMLNALNIHLYINTHVA